MNDEAKKLLGKNIKEKRELLGLSQTELAQSVHKSSPAYIAFIESGERNISAMDLMLIAKKLGTTVAQLIGESQQNKNPEVMHALRADRSLNPTDRKKVEEYYTLLKQANGGKSQ